MNGMDNSPIQLRFFQAYVSSYGTHILTNTSAERKFQKRQTVWKLCFQRKAPLAARNSLPIYLLARRPQYRVTSEQFKSLETKEGLSKMSNILTRDSACLKVNLFTTSPKLGISYLSNPSSSLPRKFKSKGRSWKNFNPYDGKFKFVLTLTFCAKNGDSRWNRARTKDYRPWAPII